MPGVGSLTLAVRVTLFMSLEIVDRSPVRGKCQGNSGSGDPETPVIRTGSLEDVDVPAGLWVNGFIADPAE
jgi:hypothetical protein